MSTAAQIAANQANSQHSTGPTSETGKAASSRNNFKFGFTCRFEVLPYENQAGFDALLAALQTEHNPATATEGILVTKMAEHYWLARRAQGLQDTTWAPENPLGDDDRLKLLAVFMRYHTTHDRAFYKALNQLQKLRAEQRKSEIGFESQKRQQAADLAAGVRREAAETRRLEDETRKLEAHEARVRLQHSKAEWNELNTEIKGSIEAILPGHTAISFADLKPFLKTAIKEFVAYKTQAA
jgi:hypothetical protein